MPVEVYTSLAFDTLFENRGSLRTLSILERVKDRAEALTRQISSSDSLRLDEYLGSVREMETRVEKSGESPGRGERAESACLLHGTAGQRNA